MAGDVKNAAVAVLALVQIASHSAALAKLILPIDDHQFTAFQSRL